jgi:hypothetical protein
MNHAPGFNIDPTLGILSLVMIFHLYTSYIIKFDTDNFTWKLVLAYSYDNYPPMMEWGGGYYFGIVHTSVRPSKFHISVLFLSNY